jgi:hypothetical protein
MKAADFHQVVGENGDGLAVMLNDMAQLFAGAELAVGHVEEIRPAMDLTERVPGFNMGGVIIAVALVNVMMDRHRAVIGHTQRVNQLLQIGPMILAVAPAQFQPGARGSGNPATRLD